MNKHKCGIYVIRQIGTDKCYVGSSKAIHERWRSHRYELRKGTHHSPHLQHAWNKYGEEQFKFSILEECCKDRLAEREQFYINALTPHFNAVLIVHPRMEMPLEIREIVNAKLRARAALITHCPKGHEYTEKNTSINQGKRICLACANERSKKALANETPEKREARRKRVAALYNKKKVERGVSEWGSEEHRSKLSASLTGRKLSAESRKKISAAAKAAMTPELKDKMQAALKERNATVGHHQLGKQQTPETRAKISATLIDKRTHCAKGHPFTPENTMRDKKLNKRICRTCRKAIKAANRANESPEKKAVRLARRRLLKN